MRPVSGDAQGTDAVNLAEMELSRMSSRGMTVPLNKVAQRLADDSTLLEREGSALRGTSMPFTVKSTPLTVAACASSVWSRRKTVSVRPPRSAWKDEPDVIEYYARDDAERAADARKAPRAPIDREPRRNDPAGLSPCLRPVPTLRIGAKCP